MKSHREVGRDTQHFGITYMKGTDPLPQAREATQNSDPRQHCILDKISYEYM